MRELRDERDSDRRDLEDARGRLALTQRALDLKIESFAPAANGSVHSGVLLELAKLQEQLAAMAKQLLSERSALRASETQEQRAQLEAQELEHRLAEREALIATLERDRTSADDKLGRVVSDVQTLACEKATLLKFIQQQAEVKFQLDAQLKSVQDDKLRTCAALHDKLEHAVDDKHKSSERVRDLERERQEQVQTLQATENALREQQDANRELQTRLSAMIDDAQREREHRRALDEELAAAKEVCRELKLRLDEQTVVMKAMKVEVTRLESVKAELEVQLSRRDDEQRALQEAMETALRDLEALSKQRNQAARAMNEAVTISASSLEEQQTLEAAVERQRKQLEQLKAAKSLLQNAMLEQLSALRKQLHAERTRRVETEAKLTQMIKFSSTKTKHCGADYMPPLASRKQTKTENRDTIVAKTSPSPDRLMSKFDEARIMLAPQSSPLPSPHLPPSLPTSVMSIQSPVAHTHTTGGTSMTREELDVAVSDLAASSSFVSSSLLSSSSASSLSSVGVQEEGVVAAVLDPIRDQLVSAVSSEYVEPQQCNLDSESPCEQLSLMELAGDI
jgi:myosin heavy subunit